MPTAARLTAAIAFAIVGYFIYQVMVPAFGDIAIPRWLPALCVLSGVWCGWVLCGKLAEGIVSGIGTGFTAVVAQASIILFVLSFAEMLSLALRRRYDGPMDAVADVFALMADGFTRFASPEMGMTLLMGGLIGGTVAGFMGKKFPR